VSQSQKRCPLLRTLEGHSFDVDSQFRIACCQNALPYAARSIGRCRPEWCLYGHILYRLFAEDMGPENLQLSSIL
jgi:hypothetical protein